MAKSAAAASPKLQLVPEPDDSNLFRHMAELPAQERLPHDSGHSFTVQFPQPVRSHPIFETAPVLHATRAQHQQPEPDAVAQRQRREA